MGGEGKAESSKGRGAYCSWSVVDGDDEYFNTDMFNLNFFGD